jgi:hypothetical protein
MTYLKPLLSLSLAIALLITFTSAKYAPNFKKDKKQIDSLSILAPIVVINKIGSKGLIADTLTTRVNKTLLANVTKRLLKNKYQLNFIESSTIENFDFTTIFTQLDDANKELQNINCNELLTQLANTNCQRYALLLHYNTTYNPRYDPHESATKGLQTNTLIINSGTSPVVNFRILILDTQQNMVVYYDDINSINFDPRIKSETEELTKKILKTIYYK